MSEMIAFCGLDCLECEALLATRADDNEMRLVIAERWSREYDADLKPTDIDCDGCTSGSQLLFGHCEVCEIRACGREKGLENCAHCDEYACEILSEFFKVVPGAKVRLDGIRSAMAS